MKTFHSITFITLILFMVMVETAVSQDITSQLRPFLTAEFQADGEIRPVVEQEGPDMYLSMTKNLMAQGEAAIAGDINGSLSFSIIGRKSVDKKTIRGHFVGWIETEEGAEIMYEATGHAFLHHEKEKETLYYTTSIRFPTSDEPYLWLEQISGILICEFNLETGKGSLQVYIPSHNTISKK